MTRVSPEVFEKQRAPSAVGQLCQAEGRFGMGSYAAREGAYLLSLVIKATLHGENLRSLLNLEIFWRKCLRYVRLLMNLREVRILSRLLAEDGLQEIPRIQPAFPFKFLHEQFLCRGLSSSDRLRCLLTNLRFWKSTLTAAALAEVAGGQSRTSFDTHKSGCRVSIVFRLSHPAYLEGEMSAILKVDELEAYVVSFTVIPGSIVGCDSAQVLLISRMQGVKGALSACRRAQEVIGIQAPRALLDAVQGLAMAFGIEWLCAVRAENQPFYAPDQHDVFRAAYDCFFEAVGMSAGPKGFLRAHVPLPRNPVSAANRRRARKRQGIREALIEAVRARAGGLRRDCEQGNGVSETARNARGAWR